MIAVKEITFKGPEAHYNLTYFLSNDKFHCLGYIPRDQIEPVMFKVPMKFNSKGRTFTNATNVE